MFGTHPATRFYAPAMPIIFLKKITAAVAITYSNHFFHPDIAVYPAWSLHLIIIIPTVMSCWIIHI